MWRIITFSLFGLFVGLFCALTLLVFAVSFQIDRSYPTIVLVVVTAYAVWPLAIAFHFIFRTKHQLAGSPMMDIMGPYWVLISILTVIPLLAWLVCVLPPGRWIFQRHLVASNERRFRRKMAKRNRTIARNDLESKLQAGLGTLIREIRPACRRLWWTSDDLSSLGPPVTDEQVEAVSLGGDHPFNAHCLQQYTHWAAGEALLAPASLCRLPEEKLLERFPRMKTVLVVKPKYRRG